MQALWKLEKAIVIEIVQLLPQKNHSNTIFTIMSGLNRKGYLNHQAFGKTHQYFQTAKKEAIANKFLNLASQHYFDSSYKSMVSYFAKEKKLGPRVRKNFSIN